MKFETYQSPAAHKKKAPSVFSGRRVLVVDDSVDVAQSLGELLKLWGHEVILAHDGPSALERASTYLPDIIMLDIGLPGMDGYEVARKIRNDLLLKGTRIIALTGYGQESDWRARRESDFYCVFTKPVNFAELKKALT